MKKISIFLIVSIVPMFALPVMGDQLVSSQTYSNWLNCGKTQVPVPDRPSFSEGDISVYVSGFGDLVFQMKDKSTYCENVGYGWKKEGFVYGISQETNEKLLLFKISGPGSEKYIDVDGKKTLYRVSEDNADLIVSEKPKKEPGKIIEVVKEWSGQESKINQKKYYRITTKEKWDSVWKEHSDESVPDVNFDQNMVIALFVGQTVNRSRIQAVDIRETDDVIRFRYNVVGFQTINQAILTQPFGIFVLPKSNTVVRLEANVQGLIGGPPVWKEIGKLDPGDNVIEGPEKKVLTEEEYRQSEEKQRDAIKKATGN